MTDEHTFRALVILCVALCMPIGAYHRVKAATGETLSRRAEGLFILVALRLCGLAGVASLVAYMIDPSRMAWSSVALPTWLRWAGAGLGLLFAPRTGRETRREIGTRMSDMTRKLKTKMRRTADEVGSSLDDARDSLYGGNSDYSSTSDLGMDTGRRTGLTSTTT